MIIKRKCADNFRHRWLRQMKENADETGFCKYHWASLKCLTKFLVHKYNMEHGLLPRNFQWPLPCFSWDMVQKLIFVIAEFLHGINPAWSSQLTTTASPKTSSLKCLERKHFSTLSARYWVNPRRMTSHPASYVLYCIHRFYTWSRRAKEEK